MPPCASTTWPGSAPSGRAAGQASPGRQEYGGKGLTLLQQLIWYEEYAARGLPGIDACFVGSRMPDPP